MNRHRLLLVEDEAIVALDVRERLAGLGYQLAGHAVTGLEALNLTGKLKPDLILMDIRLQGDMDGITAAQEIRRLFHVPVIFLTAYSEDETLERAKLAEPYGYILKPFDDRELKSAIEIALYRHRTEQEICHLNRLYDVLSQINQSVTRVQSRQELLEEVCRVMVQRGQIDLAWIGWLDPATAVISPVAYFGSPADLLSQAPFYADGRPEGQGNPGKAIRSGEPFVCNQCVAGACLYPAEHSPERFGFNSCGSFPLLFQGQVCGVLNICASEANFFGGREVALLQEVALDISFALDKIEADAQREQLYERLQCQSAFLETLLDALPYPVFYKDAQLRYLGCNAAFEAFQGISRERLQGKTVHDLWLREQAEVYQRADQDLLANPATQIYETSMPAADGAHHDIVFHKAVFRNPDGNLGGIIGVVEDITQRKASEQALRESEERFRLMFELAAVGMAQADPRTGRWQRVNRKLCSITGYAAEELLGMRFLDITHPEDRDADWQAFQRMVAGQTLDCRNELRYIRKDGSIVWVNVNATLYRENSGRPPYSLAVIEDITEKKLAQTALEESLSLYQATLESTADGILAVNLEGRIVSWNRKFVKMWRLPEDLLKSRDNFKVREYASGQLLDPQSFLDRAQELFANPSEETYDLLHFKDGRVFERYSIPQYLKGQVVGRVLSFRNATLRVRAEGALKESESSYRRIVETANEGIWSMDGNYRTTFVNRQMAAMLGYNPGEMIGRQVTDFMFPEDLPDHQEKMDQHRQGRDGNYERRFMRKDGSELWTIVSVKALTGENGEFQGSFAMFTDITERKRAEEELKQSERRVRVKLESILAPAGDIGQLDLEDIIDSAAIQSLMDDFYQLTHLPMSLIDFQGNVLVGVGWQDICAKFHRVHPDTRRRCLESDTVLSRGASPETFKLYKCKNHLWDLATPVMVGGRHVGNLFMGQFFFEDEEPDYDFFRAQAREFGFDEDAYLAALGRVPRLERETVKLAMDFFTKLAHMISLLSLSNLKLARAVAEQERLVESLRQSEEKSRAGEEFLNDVFASIKDILCILDLEQNIVRVNPAAEKMHPGKTILGRKCYEVFAGVAEICPGCPVEQTLRTGEVCQAVTEMNGEDGERRYLDLSTFPLINRNSGKIEGIIKYVRDITKPQQAEESLAEKHRELEETAQELEQSRNMLQFIIESIPVRVFWKDRDLRYLGCNTLFARDAGLEHPQELIGKDDFVMGWKDQADIYRADDRQVMESGRLKTNIVEPQTTPGGATIWLNTSKVPLMKSSGEVFGVLGVYEDITVLVETEQQLRASLREKEVMLKEIHHRVKNNMQMISTLFDLQLKYGGAQAPPTVFRDCQNRIHSMALVHESLYQTDTLASINFRRYLQKLVDRLLPSFSSGLQAIRATVTGAEIFLDINQAVPAGLIANEIIVNCLKHAFPDQRPGEIHISLSLADGHRVIEIKDNGVGLDREFSLETSTSFGWLMIINLMKQLGGAITMTSNGGTACRLDF